MKKQIYLIRHAESIANKDNVIVGVTDCELSDKGQKQALELKEKLKRCKIDKIYSSPLKRTIQTIEPTAKSLDKTIICVDDLMEINFGIWENQSCENFAKKHPDIADYIVKTEHYIGIPTQEKIEHVAVRMSDAIEKIINKENENDIVIVSHCVAIKAFLCHALKISFEKTKDEIGEISNASITKISYDIATKHFDLIETYNWT